MCSVQSEKPVETKYIETQCNCRNKKKKKKKKTKKKKKKKNYRYCDGKTDCRKTKE